MGDRFLRLLLECFSEAELWAHARLRPGAHTLPKTGKDIRLRVEEHSEVALEARLGATADGVALERGEAVFAPSVVIRNPASSLRPKCPLSDWIRDLLADVLVRRLWVAGNGKTDLEAELKRRVLWLSPTPQPWAPWKVRAPLFPAPPKAGPTARQPAKVPVLPRDPTSTTPADPSCALALLRVGARLVECARVSLSADTRAIELSPIPGIIGFALGPACLLLDAELRGEGDGFAWIVARTEVPQLAGDLLQLRFEGSGKLTAGAGRLSAASNDLRAVLHLGCPSLTLFQKPVRLDGNLCVEVTAKELSVKAGETDFSGSMRIAAKVPGSPGEKTVFETPEIPVGVRALADGRVAAQPIEGLLDAIESQADLNGDVDKVRKPDEPAAGPKGSAEVREAIAQSTGAQVWTDNRVGLLVDGKESYALRRELIAKATKSIYLQTLIFADDETGIETAELLVRAVKRRQVKVRVIVDALGNVDFVALLENLGNVDPKAFLHTLGGREIYDFLCDGGVELQRYNDFALKDLLRLGGAMGEPLTRKLASLELGDPRALLGALLAAVGAGEPTVSGDAALGIIQNANTRVLQASPARRRRSSSPNADVLSDIVRYAASLNQRWHEKYLIVDGQRAILGGMNIADEYLLGGNNPPLAVRGRPAWRDTDVYIEGPAVADVVHCFRRNWEWLAIQAPRNPKVTAPKPEEVVAQGQLQPLEHEAGQASGEALVQIVQHRPREDGPCHNIQNAVLEHLASLERGDRAWFCNAYFLPLAALKPLADALVAAVQRGVDVAIITNSESTTDLKIRGESLINQAAVFTVRRLLEAGVHYYERTGKRTFRYFERTGDRTLHCKYALLGAEVVVVGSWNMDNRSEALNSECVAIIQDRALAGRTAETFEADMHKDVARELKLEDVEAQALEEELTSLGACAVGELL